MFTAIKLVTISLQIKVLNNSDYTLHSLSNDFIICSG